MYRWLLAGKMCYRLDYLRPTRSGVTLDRTWTKLLAVDSETSQKININSASVTEWQELPNIGSRRAQANVQPNSLFAKSAPHSRPTSTELDDQKKEKPRNHCDSADYQKADARI